MTSPISSINIASAKFGNASPSQAQIIQMQTQLFQQERENLKAKKAGVDAAWHATAIGAFLYGITTIGTVGKEIAKSITGTEQTLGTLISNSLGAGVSGSLAALSAPVALLYGLYYFINEKNK